MMVVAVTGHQMRPGIDWSWVATALGNELSKFGSGTRLWTCLATGADTLAAEAALRLGIEIAVLIPYEAYEETYEPLDRRRLDLLLAVATIVERPAVRCSEGIHFQAGRALVQKAGALLAVWDGRPAAGPGGTGDVVALALGSGVSVRHLNTEHLTVETLS